MLKFFDANPGSGLEKFRNWDGKIQIRDKHPGSATLLTNLECKVKKPKYLPNTLMCHHVLLILSKFILYTPFLTIFLNKKLLLDV
jgi:hypothetical protein